MAQSASQIALFSSPRGFHWRCDLDPLGQGSMKSNLDGSTIASVDLIGLGGRNPLGFWEGGGAGDESG